MSQSVSKKAFATELERHQGRLNLLQRKAQENGVSTILVFEGWDAAGKGGAIRRLTGALDARSYQVIPIAAPTDEERAHHYLWRFWRHLSRGGRFTIFDRSWYGRVLVERVEAFATEQEWRRAYSEINEFEEQLVEHGIVLVKYWIHITADEQLRRFKEREKAPYKKWKLTRGRLAQPGEMGRLRAGRQRDGGEDQHTAGAMDAGRGQRQEFRAPQGLADRVPQPQADHLMRGRRHRFPAPGSVRSCRRVTRFSSPRRWHATHADLVDEGRCPSSASLEGDDNEGQAASLLDRGGPRHDRPPGVLIHRRQRTTACRRCHRQRRHRWTGDQHEGTGSRRLGDR